jgi:hypothetical protein
MKYCIVLVFFFTLKIKLLLEGNMPVFIQHNKQLHDFIWKVEWENTK